MTKLKKPVKPTDEIIDKAVAKRKTLQVKVTKVLRSGDLKSMNDQVTAFMRANNIPLLSDDSDSQVKFTFGYYANYMWTKRPETDAEKRKRISEQLNRDYRNKKYQYDRQVEQEKRERQQAEATLARLNATPNPVHKVTVNCCGCKCRNA